MIHQNSLRFYKDWAVDKDYNGLVLTESAGEACFCQLHPAQKKKSLLSWVHVALNWGSASSILHVLAHQAPVMNWKGMSAAWLGHCACTSHC